MENNRQDTIRVKGFDMGNNVSEYGKIKVGLKTIDNGILQLQGLVKQDSNLNKFTRAAVSQALNERDITRIREISNYFYETNGIYQKTCNYLSNLYRYDWYIVPEIFNGATENTEKVLKDFVKILSYLDNSYVKKVCGEIASKVVVDGVYYGYIASNNTGLVLQELPVQYCRTRYSVGHQPAVEFNMRFFDEKFSDINYRMRILKLFPSEFTKGYLLYKQGKLVGDKQGEIGTWYLLDPEFTVKFSLGRNELPALVNAIPDILDLQHAQLIDRRKQLQKLLKIIVQQLPLDKNGDLIFDVDEARDIHNNVVQMLSDAIGVDVITTFADVDSIDISDSAASVSSDDLERVERSVYNAMGISQNLFNTDGNLSLEKSILNDEGSVRSLLLQFAMFFDRLVQDKSSSHRKKYNFRLYMLETTQYNYKELSKMYKEQVQIGYSKMLPQIALGHSQSAIINTAYFENEVLHLSEVMIPPLMSSTMSSEDVLGNKGQTSASTSKETVETGRPEKADDEKSEKTIANQESMS